MESINKTTTVEALKTRSSEKLFFKYLAEKLTGKCILKITPASGLSFDLLYIDEKNAALFKFMDTNEDTFDIIGEEILEVIQEEKQAVDEFLLAKIGYTINYYFVMPFVSLGGSIQNKPFLLDKEGFEDLINGDMSLTSLLSNTNNENELIFNLANEYFVYNPTVNYGDVYLDKTYKGNRIRAILMEDEQIEKINHINYGSTCIEGATGTGKSAVLLSTAIKLSRIFTNEQFVYITFDKQSNNEIRGILSSFYPDVKNLRVINFHQFVLKLGAKHNLRLNKNSRQNFNVEFKKVFLKTAAIYKGKYYYKGIFVDEAENFDQEEINFLKSIIQKNKSFFVLSSDRPKKMTQTDESSEKACFECNHHIRLSSNYRASIAVGYFNRNFQNDINTFSLLELDQIKDYFLPFDIKRKSQGKVSIIEYDDKADASEIITGIIQAYLDTGYRESDLAIIYPYNVKQQRDNKKIDSKSMLKDALNYDEIPVNFADDNSSSLHMTHGVTLSNIYNFTNIEKKVVILCQLETLYDVSEINAKKEIQKILNILYTITGRASEDLHVLIKKDPARPGIFDLLSQK